MILSDFHSHTRYCDGANTPDEMCRRAYEMGLEYFGISGHSYLPGEKWTMTPENAARYISDMVRLKEEYRGRMSIFCGVEQDIYSETPADRYDYVIGAVHCVRREGKLYGLDESEKTFLKIRDEIFGGDVYALCEEYYSLLSDVYEVTKCGIIAHVDLVTKYNEGDRLFSTKEERYIKAWRACVDRLLDTGALIEANTGAVFRGMRRTPYPAPDIREYILEHGGRLIPASDAHCASAICFGFGELGVEPAEPDFLRIK